VRLSAFRVAIESGMSDADAASLAKNLTVNFNRKGELGTAMNAAYMFFNAGVQGSARLVGALKHKRTRQIAMGIVATGIILAEMSRLAGGDDDDGESRWDKLDDYTKETNMIFLREDGSMFKVKMPYGYNLFVAAGYAIDDAARYALSGGKEGKSPLAAAGAILKAGGNAFNPMGGATAMQIVSPTLLDPFAQMAENKNFFGGPIMPDARQFGAPQPDSQRYFNSVRPISKEIAETLNELTGGSKFESGAVDVSPETLDHFWDFTTGGLGRFFADVPNAAKFATGGDVPVRRVIGLRQVFQEKSEYADRMRFDENVDRIEAAKATVKELRAANDVPALMTYIKEHPELGLYTTANSALKQARDLRRRRKMTTDAELQRQIDEQLAAIYTSLNKRYREVVK
jgi:hypothetical protein